MIILLRDPNQTPSVTRRVPTGRIVILGPSTSRVWFVLTRVSSITVCDLRFCRDNCVIVRTARLLRDRFSAEGLQAMIDLYRSGTPARIVAERYGVDVRSIKRLLHACRGVRRRVTSRSAQFVVPDEMGSLV